MVIVDTTVWIDYLGGAVTEQTGWLDRKLLQERLGLTDLILCEVLQGIREDTRFAQVHRELMRFEVFPNGGPALAIAAAQNYRFLRQLGITIRKTIHCLIATFCIRGGHSLLHRDHDFDAFEEHLNLLVIHP